MSKMTRIHKQVEVESLTSIDLSGAYAPLLTPFTPDRELIDIESLHLHLDFLEQSGLTGVLLFGTNGEFDQLAVEERLQLVDLTLSHSNKLKIIVGGTIPDSVADTYNLVSRLAEYAPRIRAVLISPPFYNMSAKEQSVPISHIVEFYRGLASIQDRLPIMLYNVPPAPRGVMTTMPVSADVVAELCDLSIIAGIKDSSAQIENIADYREAKPGIQVLVGSDFILSSGIERGASGSITMCGNVFPRAVLAVYRAKSKQARSSAQMELIQLRKLMDLYPTKRVAIQKHLLWHLGIVKKGSPVRNQVNELTGMERDTIVANLIALSEELSVTIF